MGSFQINSCALFQLCVDEEHVSLARKKLKECSGADVKGSQSKFRLEGEGQVVQKPDSELCMASSGLETM